ncbi:MAG TPA: hypothetical protein VLH56_02615 [Dissulfurispiraceae bacterium]|nr:hypothetical protein [Dissulfurispiraceae bacterium]
MRTVNVNEHEHEHEHENVGVNAGTSTNTSADQLLIQDLKKSGLDDNDNSLKAYLAQETELAAVGLRPHLYLDGPQVGAPGYVIPYYDCRGARAPFYRIKVFRPVPNAARYLQPRNTSTWIYYPPSFAALVAELLKGKGRTKVNGYPGAILLTEGEKKAAKACQEGFPTCAVGGVHSWRSHIVTLPEGTQFLKNTSNETVARLPSGALTVDATSDKKAVLAAGFADLLRLLVEHELQIIIAFDSDSPANPEVVKARAELGFEFRVRGIPTHRIRALDLPTVPDQKMGLDDFLVAHGAPSLDKLVDRCVSAKSAFPVHPNLKQLVNKRLSGSLERSEAKGLSLMLTADLDRHGIRMVEKGTGTPYYFDSRGKTLLPVNLLHHHQEPLHETRFGEFLYRQYDIGQADTKLIPWLAAAFTGEEPISLVEPRSVLALLPGNRLAYQTDDGHFVVVSGDPKNPIAIYENGSEGLLFRADQVEPIDARALEQEVRSQIRWLATKPSYQEMYWPKVLEQMQFCREGDAKILACLSYISPWLLRWNGTQLPIELMIGEPASGKSSCYSLRLQILNGRPTLRNQPADMRDWYASITSSDGLHVVDNVHLINKELRQRLSDELARITTEPSPYVELRKLFTTSENYRIPVRTVFAMTAIQQPFFNADILQRSLIMEVKAVGKEHVSDWAGNALKSLGGRINWLAHQLAVLHHFFRRADQGEWKPDQRSGHRLAHFEQMFQLIGNIIGAPDIDIVSTSLAGTAQRQVSEYDWTMEGLKEFADYYKPILTRNPKEVFTLDDVVAWALASEEYKDNQLLVNARRLARYIKSHKFMVEQVAGFQLQNRKQGNREAYCLVEVKQV